MECSSLGKHTQSIAVYGNTLTIAESCSRACCGVLGEGRLEGLDVGDDMAAGPSVGSGGGGRAGGRTGICLSSKDVQHNRIRLRAGTVWGRNPYPPPPPPCWSRCTPPLCRQMDCMRTHACSLAVIRHVCVWGGGRA